MQHTKEGAPFLAFEPLDGAPASYSSSLVTLDLRPGVSTQAAQKLAAEINGLLAGVSATVF